MGTKVAPSYANIFMGELESKLLLTAPYQPYVYLRYIDDIFMIWTGTEQELQLFYEHCNNFHRTIKFTMEFSTKEITFLDTRVRRDNNGKISFDLYCKPTDKHCYLQFKSNHPRSQKLAGPYSQFLRIRRICSNISDYDIHAKNLTDYYIRRGYPHQELLQSRAKARLANRENLLNPTRVTNVQNDRMPFVLTHERDVQYFKKAILQLWPLLSITHPQLFDKPPMFAMKIGNKISQRIVRAAFSTKTRGASGQIRRNPVEDCTIPDCKYCNCMYKSKIFKSTYTQYRYQAKLRGHCTTRNLVYMITCTKCKMQYVGETKREMKVRMTEHQRDTRKKRDTPVANHFNRPDHTLEHMRFQIIDILSSDPDDPKSTNPRKIKELYWIYQLHTLRPVGINVLG
ncbi:MAG: GIY-YIG nuclease family protein [Candidatus Thiodiazotropha taylori]|nr:GIY-YIG nuclease family protein [Candidatus Thiodiazotropha taylori]MCW4333205.1 GIY-YIG nuclease family protein [Candidatus Thiodiazotropha endolucinida]